MNNCVSDIDCNDPNSVNIIFMSLLGELSNPLLSIEEFEQTFNFIKNQLRPLYENNEDVIKSINYFDDMVKEIISNELNEDMAYGVTLIANKYLYVDENSKCNLESKYVVVQHIMQACFNQLLQQLFRYVNKKPMDENDIDNSIELFKLTVGDIISKTKKAEMREVYNEEL